MANKNPEEEDVLEFLDSLKEDKEKTSTSGGKTDAEILEFLDELEATDKQPPKETEKKLKNDIPSANETIKKPQVKEEAKEDLKEEQKDIQVNDVSQNDEVNDPITSISNWWSREGSTRVSSQLSSFWGTAQSIGEQASKQADLAIKKAREQSLEDNLRNAFKEFGITGVLEGDRDLTDDERTKLLTLPDTKQAIESLNKGFSIFSGGLSNVLEKINNKDEILEIKIVHDLKGYKNLKSFVKDNFEDVMNSQVDGNIQIDVVESGTKKETEFDGNCNLSLFNGKISDAEKLINANIEELIKKNKVQEVREDDEKKKVNKEDAKEETKAIRKSEIYIGLLASTVNKDELHGKLEDNITIDPYQSTSFCFTATLVDKTHGITITNRSQPFPLKWSNWVDGKFDEGENSDDIDPSEWVINWIDKGLDMTFGVLSQTYIIKRMGY